MTDHDPLDLTGKVVLVTGGSQGIGRAIALTFARHGASIVACDSDQFSLLGVTAELAEVGAEVLAAPFDVRDVDAVESLRDATRARFGALDVLVNNAGGTYEAPFVESNPKGDETLVLENLLSATWVTRAALPLLSDGGSIINVTTIETGRGAPGYALYAAAKAGLESLTRTLALELGARGIRVNSVAPDVIPTAGVVAVPDPPRTPLPRLGTPEDVANVVLFLASPLASFVTGTSIPVDGGNAAAGGWRREPDGGWST